MILALRFSAHTYASPKLLDLDISPVSILSRSISTLLPHATLARDCRSPPQIALLMGQVEMGISGRVFGWGLFEWVEMGCRDLRVGYAETAGWGGSV